MCPIECNSQGLWDSVYDDPNKYEWRTYPNVFGRIEFCLKHTENIANKRLLDVGCGVGIMIDRMVKATGCKAYGLDLSEVGIRKLAEKGYEGNTIDLEDPNFTLPDADILCCTEVVEHLTEPQFHKILEATKNYEKCFISTPNNCMGPDTESQHLRKLTAKQFLDILKQYRSDFRVECYDHYLLAIAGHPKGRNYKLSFTMPVKNEEADIERVLKSFRGVADEIVIGIDDKSEDKTEEIASWYADKIVKFTWEKDFSKARNTCMDACTGDWIFMSEGHENLHMGQDFLLQLDEVPEFIDVIEVKREADSSAWYFPWLCRNRPEIRYKNAVHNQLTGYADDRVARGAQISTWHERSSDKSYERMLQRKGMNKQELLEKIRETKGKDLKSMYYLANEYLDVKNEFGWRQAEYWFKHFIELSAPDPMRYQARLSLARHYFKIARRLDNLDRQQHEKKIGYLLRDAKVVLAEATIDDPTRVEHWLLLGEICESVGQLDYAMRFYEYSALGIGRNPSSYMFIDKSNYTYKPAQALVNVYAALGYYKDALVWANKIEGLMPDSAPPEALDEIRRNVKLIEEKLAKANAQETTNVAS